MKLPLTVCTTILLLAAFPVHAAKVKSTLAFDETSRDALVIVEAVPQKIVEEWSVGVSTYSLDTKLFTSNPFRGHTQLLAVAGQTASRRYFAGLVKGAGTHIVYDVRTQTWWGACFDKGARAFTFEPGKVYYLGIIDPTEALMRISTELPRESNNTPYWVYGMWLPLTAPAQQKDWEQGVAQFIADNLPKVKAPVVAAEGVEVTFKPGRAPAAPITICRADKSAAVAQR